MRVKQHGRALGLQFLNQHQLEISHVRIGRFSKAAFFADGIFNRRALVDSGHLETALRVGHAPQAPKFTGRECHCPDP